MTTRLAPALLLAGSLAAALSGCGPAPDLAITVKREPASLRGDVKFCKSDPECTNADRASNLFPKDTTYDTFRIAIDLEQPGPQSIYTRWYVSEGCPGLCELAELSLGAEPVELAVSMKCEGFTFSCTGCAAPPTVAPCPALP